MVRLTVEEISDGPTACHDHDQFKASGYSGAWKEDTSCDADTYSREITERWSGCSFLCFPRNEQTHFLRSLPECKCALSYSLVNKHIQISYSKRLFERTAVEQDCCMFAFFELLTWSEGFPSCFFPRFYI